MHFCKLNLEFTGLGYKPSNNTSNYGFNTFELYRCKKCGKLIFKNEERYGYVFNNCYEEALIYVKRCGYKPLGELIKENRNPKEENKCVLNLAK